MGTWSRCSETNLWLTCSSPGRNTRPPSGGSPGPSAGPCPPCGAPRAQHAHPPRARRAVRSPFHMMGENLPSIGVPQFYQNASLAQHVSWPRGHGRSFRCGNRDAPSLTRRIARGFERPTEGRYQWTFGGGFQTPPRVSNALNPMGPRQPPRPPRPNVGHSHRPRQATDCGSLSRVQPGQPA